MNRRQDSTDVEEEAVRRISSEDLAEDFRPQLEAIGRSVECTSVELWLVDGADRLARCTYLTREQRFHCDTIDREEGEQDHGGFIAAVLRGEGAGWEASLTNGDHVVAAPLVREDGRAGALLVDGCRSDASTVGSLLVGVAQRLARATRVYIAAIALEETRHRLTLLEKIARAILRPDDATATLQEACEAAAAAFPGLQIGYADATDPHQHRIVEVAGSGSDSLRGQLLDLSGAYHYVDALREQRVVVVNDVAAPEVEPPLREVSNHINVRSFVCVPVNVTDGEIGMVFFASPHPRKWTRLEVESLMEAAGLLLIAAKTSEHARERREAEASLRRQSEMLTRILDVAATPLVVIENGVVALFNRECERLSGYSAAEIVGTRARELPFVDPADIQKIADDFTKHPERLPRFLELAWVGRHGERRLLLWHLGVTQNEGSVTVVASGIDVTQAERLREELEQAKRIASLGRLSATVAHEFNNVMMSILPFTEVIRRVGADEPKIQNAVTHMARAIDRGRRVTQDLLRFTRPGEPSRRPLDAAQWLREFANETRPLLPANIKLETDISSAPLFVNADPLQLGQVFNNLVVNARDAMPEGGTITLTLSDVGDGSDVALAKNNAAAVFRVIDNGAGIPADIRDTIFEPLFTTKKNGTGLGLAIARQIIVGHQGSIFVDSEPGKGTTFTIVLPRENGTTPRE